jgi:hypothetical protein
MNRLYIDQIARRILDQKYETKTYYQSDIDQATAALKWMISYLDQNLVDLCLNAKVNDGLCDLSWKHLDCRVLMDILFELTNDDKYKTTEWYT